MTRHSSGGQHISTFMSQIHVKYMISPMFILTYLCYVMHTYTEHALYLGAEGDQISRMWGAVPPGPLQNRPDCKQHRAYCSDPDNKWVYWGSVMLNGVHRGSVGIHWGDWGQRSSLGFNGNPGNLLEICKVC